MRVAGCNSCCSHHLLTAINTTATTLFNSAWSFGDGTHDRLLDGVMVVLAVVIVCLYVARGCTVVVVVRQRRAGTSVPPSLPCRIESI